MDSKEWESECERQKLRREGFAARCENEGWSYSSAQSLARHQYPDPPRPMRPREVTDTNGWTYRFAKNRCGEEIIEAATCNGEWIVIDPAGRTAAYRDLFTGPAEEPVP